MHHCSSHRPSSVASLVRKKGTSSVVAAYISLNYSQKFHLSSHLTHWNTLDRLYLPRLMILLLILFILKYLKNKDDLVFP